MLILQDSTKRLCALFNCDFSQDKTKLLCGVAVFKGGLSGELQIFSEAQESFLIKIPNYVLQNNTYIAKASPFDSVEIELIKENA